MSQKKYIVETTSAIVKNNILSQTNALFPNLEDNDPFSEFDKNLRWNCITKWQQCLVSPHFIINMIQGYVPHWDRFILKKINLDEFFYLSRELHNTMEDLKF